MSRKNRNRNRQSNFQQGNKDTYQNAQASSSEHVEMPAESFDDEVVVNPLQIEETPEPTIQLPTKEFSKKFKETNSKETHEKIGLMQILAKLSLIIILLFTGFTAYRYFMDMGVIPNDTYNKLSDKISKAVNDRRDNQDKSSGKPEIAEGASTKRNEKISDSTSSSSQQASQWVATDYKQGQISKGKYTVKSGDTLWEISEAVYGNGAQWNQILSANQSSIGHLPNGSQALIVPGQVLLIN